MKEQQIKQIDIVEATDSDQLQQRMNEEMRKHPDVTGVIMPEGNACRAIIQYEITENIPEDEIDKYYLETGKHYYCGDCPDCIWDPDRRAVTHWCQFHEDRTRLKSFACEEFYLRLRSGDVKPVTAEERKKNYAEMNRIEAERRHKNQLILEKNHRLKKKTAKFCAALAEALSKDIMTHPSYIIDCADFMGDKVLLPEEICLLEYGSREPLTEKEIIDIAKEHNAFDVCRVSNPHYEDEETLVWDADVIWERGEQK